jgi:hypothetical protein
MSREYLKRILAALALSAFLAAQAIPQTTTPSTNLTLQVHWMDGIKASGTVTLTGNGLSRTVSDNNDGVYKIAAPLATNGAYIVSWKSNYYTQASLSFPFSLCVASSSLCLQPSTRPAAELDLVLARPTDAGGFRMRQAAPKITVVLP